MKTQEVVARRMHGSGLTAPMFDSPAEVVRQHLAMQAQDYGPAKWSIGQRLTGVTDEDVERAVAAGDILRTHVLRPTWHFVERSDIRWLLALTGPRVQRSGASRHRELGLDARTLRDSERVVGKELADSTHLTRKELAAALHGAGIDVEGQRLPYILMHLELQAVICSGVPRGKQQTFALLDERVPQGPAFNREEATAELTRRYLAGHGPATVQDLRWWSSITVSDIKDALDRLGTEVEGQTVNGLTMWSLATDDVPPTKVQGAHLLQTYDELIVGYTQSRYIGDPHGDDVRAAWKERSLPAGVVLMDGRIFAHWRRTLSSTSMPVELRTYGKASRRERAELERAVAKLGSFLARTPNLEMGPI